MSLPGYMPAILLVYIQGDKGRGNGKGNGDRTPEHGTAARIHPFPPILSLPNQKIWFIIFVPFSHVISKETENIFYRHVPTSSTLKIVEWRKEAIPIYFHLAACVTCFIFRPTVYSWLPISSQSKYMRKNEFPHHNIYELVCHTLDSITG